ncbi:MAG: hypothetical protein QW520_07880 [Methanomassiliicoccales archaeon]
MWMLPALNEIKIAMSIMMSLLLVFLSVLGTSASCIDTETTKISLSASGTKAWIHTTLADFLTNTMENLDVNSSPGNVMLQGKTEFLYAFRGSNSNQFLRYNTTSSTWSFLTNAPASLKNEGSSLVSDENRYLYATQGGTRQFWRYDALTNSWSNLPRTPASVKAGGGLAYDGFGNLYLIQGGGEHGFWRFSISLNAWLQLAPTPLQIDFGGCLMADGMGHIYVLCGGGTTTFLRYDASQDSWTILSSAPSTIGSGAAMAYDGAGSIYVIRGYNSPHFWKYSIETDTWNSLSPLPRAIGLGASLAFMHPGKVYAVIGDGTSLAYVYDSNKDVWSQSASLPAKVAEGAALASSPKKLLLSGSMTSSVWDTGSEGTTLVGVFWDSSTPAGTGIKLQVRSSDRLVGGQPQSEWLELGTNPQVAYVLSSGRYLQWRAYLSTNDSRFTPLLMEVRLHYL